MTDPPDTAADTRRALRDAEELMNQLRRTWDMENDAWRVRMAKDFPDVFHAWAAQLPENVNLKTDESLQTILADPLIARVRIVHDRQNLQIPQLPRVVEKRGSPVPGAATHNGHLARAAQVIRVRPGREPEPGIAVCLFDGCL